MNASDIALIKQAQEDQEGSFEKLYQRYYANAYRIAFQITKNDADAKDAVQETFIQIKRSLCTLRDVDHFYSWMARIVLSKCNRIFVKNRYPSMDPERVSIVDHNIENRSYMIPHEDNNFQNEQRILMEMIQQLKPALRDVLYLMYFEQMKQAEIAKYLDIPVNTVKTRAVRGREELKKKIERFEQVEGRKLSFQVDALFPVAAFGGFQLVVKSMKTSFEHFFTGSAVNVVSVVAVTTLTVSGSALVYEEYEQAQHPASDPVVLSQPVQEEVSPEVALVSFPTHTYFKKEVTNPKEAYFTCLNFAQTEAELKTKDKEEMLQIQPIYESLKQSNGAYWERLNRNWHETFDEHMQELQ